MRIIAGAWRGRKLEAPKGEATRPTADRVKEALFSILIAQLGGLEELKIADLFAGSGALGLEALSRGAAHCLFVEQEAQAVAALRKNIATLSAEGRSTIIARSVLTLGQAQEPLDALLLDPPYNSGAGAVALDKLARLGWIAPHTLISLETARGEVPELKAFTPLLTRVYGKAEIHILRLAA
jgi:16S rRNA (guanine966-N2)-methyltransferase